MSTWKVELTFSEGNSNKFWRARVEGSTLYVNYGRIGSDGQTQVKQLASAAAAESELAKLEKEKRKKGYEEASGDPSAKEEDDEEEGDEDEEEDDEDEAPKKKKAPAAAAPPPPAAAPAAAAPRVGAAAIAGARAKTTRLDHADYSITADGRPIDLRLTLDGTTVRTVVVERYASAEEAEQAYQRLKTQMVSDGYQPVPARDTL